MFTVLRQVQLAGNARRHFFTSRKSRGYIVLIPEIGEDAQATDGIVKQDGLPAFNDITIENCLGAIGQQAGALEKTVQSLEVCVTKDPGSMGPGRIFQELDAVTGPLDTTWGIAKALYMGNCTLIPTKTYLNIHERALKARSSKYNSRALFNGLNQCSATTTNEHAKRLLKKYHLEGRLNGLTLDAKNYELLKEIVSQLGKERTSFKNKANMAVHTFNHVINDYQLVRDFPDTLLEALVKDPGQLHQGPWKITLQPQVVKGFLKYCPDRTHRWNIWSANVQKASIQLDKSLENSTHLEKIRSLRLRLAKLLGYSSYADMSMETKMVQSVDNLKRIFTTLLQYAGPAQSTEIEELQKFATNNGFKAKLDLYDVSYWQRKLVLSEHAFDEELLRPYFPLPRVLSGVFALSERLFNIKIVQRTDAEVWQPAVRYYDIFDCDAGSPSEPISGFYVDCYSKENKFGKNSGWSVSIRNRNLAAGLTPLAALIFNFTAPTDAEKPYLLNFDDLRMVFKTFGTALQHLLTKAPFTDLAGLSNIEWDASQVASNVMNNFLDNKTVLQSISGHYLNGEPIPDALADKVHVLKTQMAGFNLCREMYLAHLDLELHQSSEFWLDVVKRLWPVYNCMPLDKKDAHPCSMTDIFSGDWAAAHFSYLHSKIIAADISEAFYENAADVSVVGKRFKDTFLSSGGSVPSAEVFRRFRGRDPSVEALLKSLNIFCTTQTTTNM